MRIRLPLRPTLYFLAAWLFALAALLPLRLALDWLGFEDRGLSARAATGSLWFGALQEAQLGPVALGDVTARLELLPLFLGRARLALAGTGPSGIEGAVTVTRHGFGIDDVNGRFRISAALPLSSLALEDVGAGFASGRCVRAEGRAGALPAAHLAAIGAAGELSGVVRCDGDALLFPLASRGGAERLDLRLFADGRYRLDLLVRPADAGVRAQLIGAGFQPAGAAVGLRIEGAFAPDAG